MVKPGNPLGFDWTDIRGKTIGFIDGFVFDDFCVARETDRIQVSESLTLTLTLILLGLLTAHTLRL